MLVFLVLSIICTLTSLIQIKLLKKAKPNHTLNILQSFSLINANRCLFTVRDHRLSIVDGLVLMYLLWDLSRMHYGLIVASGFVGYKNIRSSFIVRVIEESKYFWLRSFMPRDSIFLLSGVIIAYDFFGRTKRPTNLKQYVKFISEKYIRFLPKIVAPMLMINLIVITASGPLWEGHGDCSNIPYWKSFLFMTNLGENPSDNVRTNTISFYSLLKIVRYAQMLLKFE